MTIIPPQLIGMTVSGDMNGETFYTNRFGRTVVYPHAPPKCPPTLAQIAQRYRFVMAIRTWQARPAYLQNQYIDVARRTGIRFTGLNLWISLSFSQDRGLINTLFNQTGIMLGMPPSVWITP